jgi:hypothetical protein
VPLGPGYTIEKQRVEVTYAKEKPDRVSVRAWYQLKNTGNAPLSAITVEVPYHPEFTDNIRAEWNAGALPSAVIPDNDHQLQIAFPAAWKQGERGEFVFTYELKVVDPAYPLVVGGLPPFFLPSRDWYPALVRPAGTFAEVVGPPGKWDLVVSVPLGYHVYASGRAAGADRSAGKTSAGGVSLRYEQRPGSDFNPFVATGPYVEQQVKTSNGIVTLWTSKPVPEKRVREISERVSSDVKYLEIEFGPLGTRDLSVWIIECPPREPFFPRVDGCRTVPRSAVVSESFFRADATTAMYVDVDLQFTEAWFGEPLSSESDEPPWPVDAVSLYAGTTVVVSQSAPSRETNMRDLLHLLDSLGPDKGKAILAVRRGDQEPIPSQALARSELFFFALEDRCGEKNVHRALARILRVLRGKTWGVSDLRSAMEAECGGADLADFFREWLNKSGIPEEFRARYSGPAPAKSPGPSH